MMPLPKSSMGSLMRTQPVRVRRWRPISLYESSTQPHWRASSSGNSGMGPMSRTVCWGCVVGLSAPASASSTSIASAVVLLDAVSSGGMVRAVGVLAGASLAGVLLDSAGGTGILLARVSLAGVCGFDFGFQLPYVAFSIPPRAL